MYKKSYAEMKAEGLCPNCGKKNDRENRAICSVCAEKKSNRQKETRKVLKSYKLCARCGYGRVTMQGGSLCEECKELDRERYYQNRERLKDSKAISKQKWTDKVISQGLCYKCGVRKADENSKTCYICKAKMRREHEKTRRSQGIIPRSQFIELGLCYHCGNPIDRDGKICQKCFDKSLEGLKKAWKNTDRCKAWVEADKLIFKK